MEWIYWHFYNRRIRRIVNSLNNLTVHWVCIPRVCLFSASAASQMWPISFSNKYQISLFAVDSCSVTRNRKITCNNVICQKVCQIKIKITQKVIWNQNHKSLKVIWNHDFKSNDFKSLPSLVFQCKHKARYIIGLAN